MSWYIILIYQYPILYKFLPKNNRQKKNEYVAFIINLGNLEGNETHWVAIRKIRNAILHFVSFGDLPAFSLSGSYC